MIVIGLCGNSGSGKGTVCNIFKKYGISSIDADKVYHDLTAKPSSELNQKLAERFGREILNDDLSLNRKALSKIVFSDDSGKLLSALNAITHSAVIARTEQILDELSKRGERAAIFDAPLLFESGFNKKCDVIIAVTADSETKIDRITARDNISREAAIKRINAQLSEIFLQNNADYVINNVGGEEELEAQIKMIIKKLYKCED